MSFVHLHFHTSYSFLDGYNLIHRAVARLKELGQTACAITDHNHLGGCPEFYEVCKKNGIKPLLGCELYFTPCMQEITKPLKERKQEAIDKATEAGLFKDFDMKKATQKAIMEIAQPYMYNTRSYHILFIAKNQTGWNNLVKLQSEAARIGKFNGRHHCDYDLIAKYHKGLICTTACIGSYPSHCVQDGDYGLATCYLKAMKNIFGDDFYLEIQPLNIDKQRATNIFYMEQAEELDIKCVATNDVHYTLKEDWDDHDTLICIGIGRTKSDPERMKYSNDFWIKSEEEMTQCFKKQCDSIASQEYVFPEEAEAYHKFYLEAIKNTNEVSDKVTDKIELGSPIPLFSKVKVPKGFTPESWFVRKAWLGLYKYLSKHPELNVHQYEQRLHDELEIIVPKGFAPYFLAVEEYVTWANANECPTGPGRGSAAGSLVLFSLGVTKNIEPIQYGLWFSRFMTKDRMAPPDIDIDFSWEHRDDVIHHLEDYYGKECVAHIGTYTLEGVKSGITDVGRVLNIPISTVKNITKKISEIAGGPAKPISFKDLDALKDGDKNEPQLWEEFHKLETDNPEVFRLARAFEGVHRNSSVHASGVLVTPMPVTDLFPTQYTNGVATTYYTGPQLESLNAVKYDILGLKTLDIIKKALNSIDKNMTMDTLYDSVDVNDPKLYSMIANKETDAVFQLSSNMMKGIIDRIKPTTFNDIVAINSVGRPGPVSVHMDQDYADVKNGEALPNYPIRGCEDILDETFGVIAYQEELMAISKRVSGFDDSQADSITRKIIAKKKKALMPLLIRSHIYGKKNCKGPEGWEEDEHAPWYDEDAHYGGEIKGAIANGYSEEEMLKYFKTIDGFSSYCFNKSHAACYSYIGILTAWLKRYHPAEFMAAVLTMAESDKFIEMLHVTEKIGLRVLPPDIALSGKDFTPNGNDILYGLGSVKGVGGAALPEILAAQPIESIEDALIRISKKAFKKNVGENLIKAGAFDRVEDEQNRNTLLNRFYDLRKDKENKVPRLDPDSYNENTCIKYEEEMFGVSLTHKRWWDSLAENAQVTIDVEIEEMREHNDKNQNLMAFFTLHHNNSSFPAMMFSSNYCEYAGLFMGGVGSRVTVKGKKNTKNTFQISSAIAC